MQTQGKPHKDRLDAILQTISFTSQLTLDPAIRKNVNQNRKNKKETPVPLKTKTKKNNNQKKTPLKPDLSEFPTENK